MFNVHFTAVINYIQSPCVEIQNRLQRFLRKSEPIPTHTKFEKNTLPNPTQPMDRLIDPAHGQLF